MNSLASFFADSIDPINMRLFHRALLTDLIEHELGVRVLVAGRHLRASHEDLGGQRTARGRREFARARVDGPRTRGVHQFVIR